MKRVITGTFLAATFAAGLSAQTPAPPYPSSQAQPSTQDSRDAAKSVTVTGCLKAGDSAESFILSDLKFSDKAKGSGAVGTAGATTVPPAIASATQLTIIPSANTKLTEHIGHVVEVTGAVSDKARAGASTTPTEPGAPRQSSTAAGPSVEVRSVKMVAATCTPQ